MGLNYESVNKHKKYDPELKFMGDYDPMMSKLMSQHSKRQNGTRTKGKPQPWICHYCGRKGHIRPFCFKLYGYPKRSLQPAPEP
ncbi:gag-protease polyprotein, partial [Trifolium medium]|nr:gag-protease polyprotein [Trifolium medium]